MSDLIDDPAPGENAPEYTVTELSGGIKRLIEGEFGHVRVRGEVGRVSRPASGHLYLDLKDDRAVLASVIWKGVARQLRTRPEEGMEVVATGKLTTFAGQSRYQMVIEHIAPAGVGALMAMLEKRKAALAAEGLFAPDRKQAIPYLPEVIGVVTSPSGAVIRDILHRLRDRFPRKVLIWPVAVQGDKCAPEVTAAIDGFNRLKPGGAIPRPDLIIVARGGGSIEDLWGFNEESVVRAAAASRIPLISAVGHETDWTLIDHAADIRAPTPTAAAELAVPVMADLLAHLAKLEERRRRGQAAALQNRRQRLRDLARALPKPDDLVSAQAQRFDHLSARLTSALKHVTQAARVRLAKSAAALRPGMLKSAIRENRRALDHAGNRLPKALATGLAVRRARLDASAGRVRLAVMLAEITRKRQVLDRLAGGFVQAATTGTARQRARLDALERLRLTLGYRATLQRGYAVVRGAAGQVLTNAAAASGEAALEIEFLDDRITAVPVGGKPVRPAARPKPPGGQGSLF
ncbi:MAG: exodeoxyribonuclease VII large subunit [Rhodobacteraceae bacterium]|nr:exodeoxyribonuclease VII large subunit [Paracoccaceae bacterium]